MAGGDAEARLILRGVDENATSTIRNVNKETRSLTSQWKELKKDSLESNIAWIKSSQALHQVSAGLNMAGNSMERLGLLTKDQAAAMNTGLAIMNLFVGAAMAIQGIIALVNALKTSTIALTIVQALQTGLIPFIGPALVIAAIAAAAGAAIFLATAQTSPGQSRTVTESGPVYAHKGESIGRVSQPGRAGGGFNITIQTGALDIGSFYDRRDLEKRISKAVNG